MLDFFLEFKKREHLSPTFGEIQNACYLSSKSVVSYELRALKRLRALTYDYRKPRSIVLAEEAL